MTQVIEEQSAGMLAESIERQRRGLRTSRLLRGIAHLVADGGPFVGWIFASGVLLWALVIERNWYFWRVLPAQAAAMQAEWMARTDRSSWCARQIRQAMISRLNAAMTAGFPVMQVLVPMSPLLGLIGTVTRHAGGVRLDGAARQRRRAQHGQRRVRRR